MQEEALYQYWHYYALEGKEIKLSGGHRLRIIHEGELNRRKGPDIQFAQFALDDIVYQGDVEFHLSSSGWYQHGHNLDKAYANVLLHLIASGDTLAVNHQLSKSSIATYILPAPLHLNLNQHTARTCLAGAKPLTQIKESLITMALNRLDFKIHAYRSLLEYHQPEVIFYENIFDMLGLPNNRLPFRLLAKKITLSYFRQLSSYSADCGHLLLALYFGQAGFLSHANPDSYTQSLIENYKRYRYLLPEVQISSSNWDMHLIRTHNHPHFRLAAWVYTLLHYYPQTIFDLIKEVFRERPHYKQLEIQLIKLFDLEIENYWQDHYALNKRLKHRHQKYWGRGRLTEMLLNVIIPLMIAIAEQEGSYGFAEYLRWFYLTIPTKVHYGKIERNMPWYSSYSKQLSQPALMQALIYLDNNYCQDYHCEQCPLGRKQLRTMKKEK
jgi:hypothetical protein